MNLVAAGPAEVWEPDDHLAQVFSSIAILSCPVEGWGRQYSVKIAEIPQTILITISIAMDDMPPSEWCS